MTTFSDVIGFISDPENYIIRAGKDKVVFLDEYGLSCGKNANFYLFGNEYGATHLVHALSLEDAYGAVIDESPTIPEDELIEAYGIVDSYREEYEKTHPYPNTWQRYELTEWLKNYKIACRARLNELNEQGKETGNYPELVEGYQYQNNASFATTGIVSVSDYMWQRGVDSSDITIEKKD